jgi:uncharacterized protein (DUF2236 family)
VTTTVAGRTRIEGLRGRGAGGSFGDGSVAWTVHRERVLLLSGGRSLLMQAAHPLALAGFLGHSAYDEEPWGRLWRTAHSMMMAIFGTREQAEAVGERVRAMHTRVNGELTEPLGSFPAGTRYSAEDPELLLWIHANFVHGAIVVYEALVRRMSDRDKDAYHEEMKAVAELFSLPAAAIPATWADLDDYVEDMVASDVVTVTQQAREVARGTVLGPPLPLGLRQGWPLVNFLIAGLLPEPIRRGYGLGWTPAHTALFTATMAAGKRLAIPLVPTPLKRYSPRD